MEALKSLEAVGFMLAYVDKQALAAFPESQTGNAKFDLVPIGKLGDFVPCAEVREHTSDLIAVCSMIRDDPGVVDGDPIAVQVKVGGRYSCAIFGCWYGRRKVFVGWDGLGWCGGIRGPVLRN
jgi:uncharacterized Zn-binding protein involved in type VI secretion